MSGPLRHGRIDVLQAIGSVCAWSLEVNEMGPSLFSEGVVRFDWELRKIPGQEDV